MTGRPKTRSTYTPPSMAPRNSHSPSGSSPATSARSPEPSRLSRTTTRRVGRSSARSIPAPGAASMIGFTGPPGVGKSTLLGGADEARARARADGRRALDRPVLSVHQGRAARRPDPAHRPLPRPGRVHPLDGQSRRARRTQRGDAPGGAADGRLRARRRAARDGRRRAGRGRHHRPRRHGRARPDAGLRRFDPGAQGRRDGDPRRDRRQQGRPSRSPTRWCGRSRACWRSARREGWQVPIVKTEALRDEGIEELVEKLAEHRAYIEAEGTLSERRRRNLMSEVLGDRDVPDAPRARGGDQRGPGGAGAARPGRVAARSIRRAPRPRSCSGARQP